MNALISPEAPKLFNGQGGRTYKGKEEGLNQASFYPSKIRIARHAAPEQLRYAGCRRP